MQQDHPQKFLIIGPSWVGDMVMAQSLFRHLKDHYPDCSISVMAPRWALPLVERMPEVSHGLNLPFDHGELKLWQRRQVGRQLRQDGYTHAIVLPNSFKSALVPFHAAIPVRIGWLGEKRWPLFTESRRLDKTALPLMVQRFVALAYAAGERLPDRILRPRLQTDATAVKQALIGLGLEPPPRLLAICPGAEFGRSKQWPARHYAQLCNAKLSEGWHVWMFGSENDQQMTSAIMNQIAPEHRARVQDLAGKTSLAQAIDLLSLATVVVSNDSGLMHIAAALDRPVVALYGSTSPDFTPPLTERVKLLFTEIECRPCFKRECPFGHLRCLTELMPERAISAVEDLTSASQQETA